MMLGDAGGHDELEQCAHWNEVDDPEMGISDLERCEECDRCDSANEAAYERAYSYPDPWQPSAAQIAASTPTECSICRRVHGLEIIHACE